MLSFIRHYRRRAFLATLVSILCLTFVASAQSGPSRTSADVPNQPPVNLIVSIPDVVPELAYVDDEIVYMIRVKCGGSVDAEAVEVTAILPANTELVGTSGGTCVGSGPVVCQIGTIGNGSRKDLFITVRALEIGLATMSATARTTGADPSDPTDAAEGSAYVSPSADVEIDVSDVDDPVGPQGTVAYTIDVTNHGPDPAEDVNASASGSAGLLFVSNSGDCTTAFPCALGTLAAGETATITSLWQVAPATFGTVSLTATGGPSGPSDFDLSNNEDTETTAIAHPDVDVTKSGPSSVDAEEDATVVYTIEVANEGDWAATGVVLNDPTPAGLSFVSATGACTAFPCAIGTLAAGASVSTEVTYEVTAAVGATVTNVATATSTSEDLDSENDSDSAETLVTDCPAIEIEGPAEVCAGSPVTLTAPAGFTSYLWSTGAGTAEITVTLDETSEITVTVTDAGGCTIVDAHTVELIETNATIAAASAVDASSDGNVASVPQQPGATYAWSIVNGIITSGADEREVEYTAGSSGDVTLNVAVTVDGCTTQGSESIDIRPAPEPCATIPPVLTAPAGGASANSPVTFSWSLVAGALEYEVWLDGELLAVTTTSSVKRAISSGEHTWYVVALAGEECGPLQSEIRDLVVAVGAGCASNPTPQLTAPLGGTVLSPVTFSWTEAPGAISYKVWVEIDGTARQDVGSTSGALSLIVNLPEGSVVAYVEAKFGGCPSTWSSEVAFDVEVIDPCTLREMATPLEPSTGTVLPSSNAEFRWGPAAGASGYRVWASVDGRTPAVLGTTADTLFTERIDHGVVEWWIEALYDGCASTFSEPWRLTIPARTFGCGATAAQPLSPVDGAEVTGGEVTFQWSAVPGALTHELWVAYASGTPALVAIADGSATSLTKPMPEGRLSWFVRTTFDRCPSRDSASLDFINELPAGCGEHRRPVLITPLRGSKLAGTVDFTWHEVPGAVRYRVYVARAGGEPAPAGSTTSTSLSGVNLVPGVVRWFVRALFDGGCAPLDSTEQHFTMVNAPAACSLLDPPVISAPSRISSGVPFTLHWSPVPGATTYQVQVASNAGFDGAHTVITREPRHSITLEDPVDLPRPTYFRARAIDSRCFPDARVSPYGPGKGVWAIPRNSTEASLLPGSGDVVLFTIPLGPELAGQTFTAVAIDPWLSVDPEAGLVPAEGTFVSVMVHTAGLTQGTNIGTVVITLTTPSARVASNGTTVITSTFSVTLVTPVSPTPDSTPPPDALVIPAVAHAAGIHSLFRSDLRIANTSPAVMAYQLSFIPSGKTGISVGSRSSFDLEAGQTMAIDDILRTWFGGGDEGGTGVVELRPLVDSASSTPDAAFSGLSSVVTFASSRMYNSTSTGTLGQFIPAVPYANFASLAAEGQTPNLLSLQHLAQSAAYRTNVGLVEGSGNAATAMLSFFAGSGGMIDQMTVDLAGGEHQQLNALLASRGITTDGDGRIEIQVLTPGGKVTGYASVLDNGTHDALLVTPVSVHGQGAMKWVVPGAADLAAGSASWRTDMRLFNAGAEDLDLDLLFYSQHGGEPREASLTVSAGKVLSLDRSVVNLFGVSQDAGAIHIVSDRDARLIATARTYNQDLVGTYGQFIPAVTLEDTTGLGQRPLQILQLEESERFRSNVGLAEISGNAVTIELSIVPPDSKYTAVTELQLAPNEFRQIGSILRAVGLTSAFNTRVTVRVIGGEGHVTAYASVIDMQTNDPIFIPAQ